MAGCDSGQSERPAGGPRAGEMTSSFTLLVSVTGGLLCRVTFIVGECPYCCTQQTDVTLNIHAPKTDKKWHVE